MIRCADMEPLIADYADGTASERSRRIVERHVQLCDRCRTRLQLAVQVAQQLKRLPLLPVGVSSRAVRLRRRLEGQLNRGRRGLEHYPFYVSMIIAAVLMAATLLLIFYLGL